LISLLISCSGNPKKSKPQIAGQWQLLGIKFFADSAGKAPSPTIFTFNEDASYKFELYKADSLFIIYNGDYRFIDNDKLLEITYEYEGEKNTDTAAMLKITETEMQLFDKINKDTLFFKKKQ